MGCYLSTLIIKDGRLYDRLGGRYVDHEEVPTLPIEIVEQLTPVSYKEKEKKMKNPWKVETVKFPEVVMSYGNILCTFFLLWGNKQLLVNKRSDAQVYDPENLFIPKRIFNEMKKQALAILNDHKNRYEQVRQKPQQFLLPL